MIDRMKNTTKAQASIGSTDRPAPSRKAARSAVVFADADCSVPWGGSIVRLSHNEPWDGADDFVAARPDLFRSLPTRLRCSTGKGYADVAALGR